MMGRLRLELQIFLLALQFLTRLPVPQNVPYSDDLAIRSAKFYPAVGAVIGAIAGIVLWTSAQVFPPVVAVLLSLAASLLTTGGFHEDGLADTADGLWGGSTRDRCLEIMRDSRVGSYGVLALGMVLALKVALLTALSPGVAAWTLVAAHSLGRMSAIQIIATTEYARTTGAKFVAPTITRAGYCYAFVTALGVLFALGPRLGAMPVLTAVTGAVVLTLIVRRVCLNKLGGYTGDCLGAAEQMSELGFYMGVVLWLSL